MTTYSIQAPDGKTYHIEGPEGASDEQVAAEVMRQNPHLNVGSPKSTDSEISNAPPQQSAETVPTLQVPGASLGDKVVGSLPARIGAGMAAPFAGAFQAGANLGDSAVNLARETQLGRYIFAEPELGKKVAELVAAYEGSKKRGMLAAGDQGMDVGGLLGSVVTGGIAAKGIPAATTFFGKIGQGAGAGAVAGATAPSSTPGLENTVQQGAVGGVLGGVVPAVWPAIPAVKHAIVEPLTKKGREGIKGEAYLRATGDKASQVVSTLRNSAGTERVPGYKPTAGEAAVPAGSAEFAALQASANKVRPSEKLALDDANNAALLGQVRSVAGTPGDMAAAKTTREANANKLGAAASRQRIPKQEVDAALPLILNLQSRPIFQQAVADARKLAANDGIAISNTAKSFKEGLHYTKIALDNRIAALSNNKTRYGQRQLQAAQQTKDDLLATIDQIWPKYGDARKAYATDSAPINQMEVGTFLEDQLTPILGETTNKLRATKFAGAVQQAPSTIKKAITGTPRFTQLTEVLTPVQQEAIDSVLFNLGRSARFEDMARRGSATGNNVLDTASKHIISNVGGKQVPNPLSRWITIFNAIMTRLQGKIDADLAQEIAKEMADPKVVADALEKATIRKANREATSNMLGAWRAPAIDAGVRTNNAFNNE